MADNSAILKCLLPLGVVDLVTVEVADREGKVHVAIWKNGVVSDAVCWQRAWCEELRDCGDAHRRGVSW